MLLEWGASTKLRRGGAGAGEGGADNGSQAVVDAVQDPFADPVAEERIMDEFELIVRQAVELAVVGPIAYDLQFLAMMVRCGKCPSVPV